MPYTSVNDAYLCYIQQCRICDNMIRNSRMDGEHSFSAHLLLMSHTHDFWAGASAITQEMSLVTDQYVNGEAEMY